MDHGAILSKDHPHSCILKESFLSASQELPAAHRGFLQRARRVPVEQLLAQAKKQDKKLLLCGHVCPLFPHAPVTVLPYAKKGRVENHVAQMGLIVSVYRHHDGFDTCHQRWIFPSHIWHAIVAVKSDSE